MQEANRHHPLGHRKSPRKVSAGCIQRAASASARPGAVAPVARPPLETTYGTPAGARVAGHIVRISDGDAVDRDEMPGVLPRSWRAQRQEEAA
eukprot:5027191-Amphidinium_carterae.1